jgi:hypothetical protein
VSIVDAGPALMNAFLWNQPLIDAVDRNLHVMDADAGIWHPTCDERCCWQGC